MRQARLKVPGDRPVGYYHCFSRVVDRRAIFGAAEKERFVALMREYEAFCDVRILTYCVMSNHFHILLEVPRPPVPEHRPDFAEVLRRLGRLSGHQDLGAVRQRVDGYRRQGNSAAEAGYLATFHARMWDVSAFMKLLKQRFTQWYNGRKGRKGTLWEERFKSVLVDGAGRALVTMAAYIDLNPVRARLVKDPRHYRWCGYAEAVAGRRAACLGLQAIARVLGHGRQETPRRALEAYRQHVCAAGSEQREGVRPGGRPRRGALPHEAVLRVLAEKGRLPPHEYLRCRVRYFCDGAVFGSREFVEDIFLRNRSRYGPKRRTGARRMRGLEPGDLFVLRDLRVRVFG